MERRSVKVKKPPKSAQNASVLGAAELERIAGLFSASSTLDQAQASAFYANLLPKLAEKFAAAPGVVEACAATIIKVCDQIPDKDKVALVFDRLALEVFDQINGRIYEFESSLRSALISSDLHVMDRSDQEDLIRKRDMQALFECAIAKANSGDNELLAALNQVYRLHLAIEMRSNNSSQEQFVSGPVRDVFYDYVTAEVQPYVATLGPGTAYLYLDRLIASTKAMTRLLTALNGALDCATIESACGDASVQELLQKRGLIQLLKVKGLADQALCVIDSLTPDFNGQLVDLEICKSQAFVRSNESRDLWEFATSPFTCGFSASCAALFMPAQRFEGIFVAHGNGSTLILSTEEVPYLEDASEYGLVLEIPSIVGRAIIERRDDTITIFSDSKPVWCGDLDKLISLRSHSLEAIDVRVSSIVLDSKVLQIIAPQCGDAAREQALRVKLGQALVMIAKSQVEAVQSSVDQITQICVSTDRAASRFLQPIDHADDSFQLGFTRLDSDFGALDIALEIIDGAAKKHLRELPSDVLLKSATQVSDPISIGVSQLSSVQGTLTSILSESLQVRFLRAAERLRIIGTEVLCASAVRHRDRLRLLQPLLTTQLNPEARAFVFELLGRAELMSAASEHFPTCEASSNALPRIVDLPVEPLDNDEAVMVVSARDHASAAPRTDYYSKISKLAAGSGFLVPLPKIQGESTELVRVESSNLAVFKQSLTAQVSNASRLLADYENLREKIEQERIRDEARMQRAQSLNQSESGLVVVEQVINSWIAERLTSDEGEWDNPIEIETGYEELSVFALDAVERRDTQQFRWALEETFQQLNLSFDENEFDDLMRELRGAVATVAASESRHKFDDLDVRSKLDQFFSFLTSSEHVSSFARNLDTLISAAHDNTRSDDEVRALAAELVDLALRQQMPSSIVQHMIDTFGDLRNKPILTEDDFHRLERQAEEVLTIPGRGFLHDGAIFFLQHDTGEILDLCAAVMPANTDFDIAGSTLEERISDVRELWTDMRIFEPADARAAFMILGTTVTETAVLDRLKYELLRDRQRNRHDAGANREYGPLAQPSDLVALVLTRTFSDTQVGARAFRDNVVETLYQRYIAPLRLSRSSASDHSLGAQAARLERELEKLGIKPDATMQARAALDRGELPIAFDQSTRALPQNPSALESDADSE